MEQTPRQMRISSGLRGVLIALLIGAFAWVGAAPGGSLTVSLLIGATVLAFALGVYGGILRQAGAF